MSGMFTTVRRVRGALHSLVSAHACAVLVCLMSTAFCVESKGDYPHDISADEFAELYYSSRHSGFVPAKFEARPDSLKDISRAHPFPAGTSSHDRRPIVLIPHRDGTFWLFVEDVVCKCVQTDVSASPWERPAMGFAVAPDGSAFASFGDNGIIRVYSRDGLSDLAGAVRRPLIIQEGWLVDKPDRSDGVAKQDEAVDPKRLSIRVPVKGVIFAHDGSRLFGLMVDGSVHVWSAVTGQYIRMVRAGSAIRGAVDVEPAKWRPTGGELTQFFRSSPDRRSLLCPSKLEHWSLPAFAPNDTEIGELHLSADEKSLSLGWNRRKTFFVDVESGKELYRLDNRRVLAADRSKNFWYTIARWYDAERGHHFSIDCVDARTGKVLAQDILKHRHVSNTAIAAGTVARLAVDAASHKGGERSIHIYDFKDREVVLGRVFEDVTGDTSLLGISPDGRWLIIGRKNGIIQSIDLENGAVANVTQDVKE
jgi:WD40 repeat protein